jgi:hypothetical protein
VVTASELVKLYGQKFDLLQSGASAAAAGGGNGGASGPHQAAIKCLEDLKATIAHHLKVRGWVCCVGWSSVACAARRRWCRWRRAG